MASIGRKKSTSKEYAENRWLEKAVKFKCNRCNPKGQNKFTKFQMERHYYKKHYYCQPCDLELINLNQTIGHLESFHHETLKCDKCEFFSFSSASLIIHKKSAHTLAGGIVASLLNEKNSIMEPPLGGTQRLRKSSRKRTIGTRSVKQEIDIENDLTAIKLEVNEDFVPEQQSM